MNSVAVESGMQPHIWINYIIMPYAYRPPDHYQDKHGKALLVYLCSSQHLGICINVLYLVTVESRIYSYDNLGNYKTSLYLP